MDNLPTSITDDPRIGRMVQGPSGDTGRIDHIIRFAGGLEYFSFTNEQTGLGHGGLELHEIIFVDEQEQVQA